MGNKCPNECPNFIHLLQADEKTKLIVDLWARSESIEYCVSQLNEKGFTENEVYDLVSCVFDLLDIQQEIDFANYV